MTKKLNDADPTIVDGPSSPGLDPSVYTVSMTLRRISGALEPRAMRVRLATVGFHTFTLVCTICPVYGSCFYTTRFDAVICSIALNKKRR